MGKPNIQDRTLDLQQAELLVWPVRDSNLHRFGMQGFEPYLDLRTFRIIPSQSGSGHLRVPRVIQLTTRKQERWSIMVHKFDRGAFENVLRVQVQFSPSRK